MRLGVMSSHFRFIAQIVVFVVVWLLFFIWQISDSNVSWSRSNTDSYAQIKITRYLTSNAAQYSTEEDTAATDVGIYGFIYKLMCSVSWHMWADGKKDEETDPNFNYGFLLCYGCYFSIDLCVDVEPNPEVVESWCEWLHRNRFLESRFLESQRLPSANQHLPTTLVAYSVQVNK